LKRSVNLGAAAALAAGLGLAPQHVGAATEQVVTDWHTGLAISGFDPVAYFADATPTVGRSNVEYAFARVVWRFDNEGNRAAFLADPEVYMPRFGGYDPTAVARGVPTPGNPLQWQIVKDRLYLFYSAQARAAFAADPDGFIAAAERRWPQVSRTLTP
jgi:hypothetical protein